MASMCENCQSLTGVAEFGLFVRVGMWHLGRSVVWGFGSAVESGMGVGRCC